MASLVNITFACENLGRLADFWAAALDYEIQEAPPGLLEAIEAEGGDVNTAAAAIDSEGRGPRLFFKKMPRSSPDHIPIHLTTADHEAEVERLAGLEASVVETRTETTGPHTETWPVMRDPPGERLLRAITAGCVSKFLASLSENTQ